MLEKFFKLKENGTTVGTEVMAGLTTFFAMSYILFVNPSILGQTGMPTQAVFLATIIASVIGTLIMGLYANVPYAQAPGMGLNAFFTFTVVFALGYTWQQALAMVFICGIINIIITVTRIRKAIMKAIPLSLQHAIGGGIGIFIAYVGIKNAGLLQFLSDPGAYVVLDDKAPVGQSSIIANSSAVPELVKFNNPGVLLALVGIVITMFFVLKNIRGGILLSILLTTLIALATGIVKVDFSTLLQENNIAVAFKELGTTFGAAFGKEGMGSLFADSSKIPQVCMTILAFSLSDTFDTLGTFIGTGRKTGIFSEEDEKALEEGDGVSSKMDRALIADAVATSIGAVFGTSNTTTYVESAAGIGAGGRTGLTSVVVAAMFMISSLFSPVLALVPTQATAPVLIIVGMMMLSSFADIEWSNLDEAIPAFFTSVFMGFAYSISYGIAAGFIMFTLVKIIRGKFSEIHIVIWIVDILFIANFAILAML
ncbi:guanine permease [Floricoccus tropicus]|uniref:Guanine permease n=1 Tax=Floricoccus tropicus TaxID=1859473 RepID=A0A1E8GQL7_9LACT|nr:NCS2 family permease [Floricoccus tropicus]OFI50525.1 guanine permease [Floricoccus tropicus]